MHKTQLLPQQTKDNIYVNFRYKVVAAFPWPKKAVCIQFMGALIWIESVFLRTTNSRMIVCMYRQLFKCYLIYAIQLLYHVQNR